MTLALTLTLISHRKTSLIARNLSPLNLNSLIAQNLSPRPKPSQSQDKGQSTKKKQGSRLSYLDETKAWLRDEDIANICHENYKDYQIAVDSFQNLDWFCHYPIPADLVPIKFDQVRDIFIDKLPWSRL
jgi:hypothetical protein